MLSVTNKEPVVYDPFKYVRVGRGLKLSEHEEHSL